MAALVPAEYSPVSSMDSGCGDEDRTNGILIIVIHTEQVSLSVLRPSGEVINLRLDRPELHPVGGPKPDPYTIPFQVGLHQPFDFLYGAWAKYCETLDSTGAYRLWDLGVGLNTDYQSEEVQVIHHSDEHRSIMSVELILSQFIYYVIYLVELLPWDENLFKLNDHIYFVVPFSTSSLGRQRILNSVKALRKTAFLVNEGTLAATVYFHASPSLLPAPKETAGEIPAPGQKLLLFVEQSGNVDLYFFVKMDGCQEMIGFTGTSYFFPETFEHEEIMELEEELESVFGQEFKKTYSTVGRETTAGQHKLIWGLLRDLKLRLPPRYRPLYQKSVPRICVVENDSWNHIIMKECRDYFGMTDTEQIEDDMTFPTTAEKDPWREVLLNGACRMLCCTNVDYNNIFHQVMHVKELPAYQLIAVEYFSNDDNQENVYWVKQPHGTSTLTLTRGTREVILTHRNDVINQYFPIGTLTLPLILQTKYANLELEVKWIPQFGVYSWEGVWGVDSKGRHRVALSLGRDYQWKSVEFTSEAMYLLKQELAIIQDYANKKVELTQKISEYMQQMDVGKPWWYTQEKIEEGRRLKRTLLPTANPAINESWRKSLPNLWGVLTDVVHKWVKI